MYYLVGIKGAGMSALALILNDLGYKVVGYDDNKNHQFTEDKLIERGIEIFTDSSFDLDKTYTVIRSTAIDPNTHSEIIRAKELNLKIYEYFEMLGKATKMQKTISVAGCHGKTTTTSILAQVLDNLEGCNYLIGDGRGHADKENDWFVLEACEYKRHFLHYTSEFSIITNIDLDHVDYYKSLDDMILAYQEFIINTNKIVIACGDDKNVRKLVVNKPIFYYGIGKDNDIVAVNIERSETGVKFDVMIEDNLYGHFDLPFFGDHMILNTLAVIGVCYYKRIPAKYVSKQLKKMKLANRRFNETELGNNIIIDDYAHHPNEVKATIEAARQKYPSKKIVAIFEPHTYSRTEKFADELAKELSKADSAYILPIFYAREKADNYPGVSRKLIIDNTSNGHSIEKNEVDKLLEHMDAVFLFMSPKQIDELQFSLEEKLRLM